MEYIEYKALEDYLNNLSKYKAEQKDYYQLLLLKSIYDKLNTIEVNVGINSNANKELGE